MYIYKHLNKMSQDLHKSVIFSFTCERCEKAFNSKAHLVQHQHKKKPCLIRDESNNAGSICLSGSNIDSSLMDIVNAHKLLNEKYEVAIKQLRWMDEEIKRLSIGNRHLKSKLKQIARIVNNGGMIEETDETSV